MQMAAIPAVMIRGALKMLDDDTSVDMIVSVRNGAILMFPVDDDPNLNVMLDRYEWEAINKIAQEEFKRIDAQPKSAKGFDK